MPSITFESTLGIRVAEAAENESLMQAAVRSNVPGIQGECGGEMSCGTCHVYVRAPWRDSILSASADEKDLLDMIDDVTDDSRLACQIKCSSHLDGMEVEVP
jgi:2Fe-2S ferredoxin